VFAAAGECAEHQQGRCAALAHVRPLFEVGIDGVGGNISRNYGTYRGGGGGGGGGGGADGGGAGERESSQLLFEERRVGIRTLLEALVEFGFTYQPDYW
jgi:hypothetical protein